MLGRSLGNYGVVSKIAEGGMGVVYLARHMTLGRPAAIKVLRPTQVASRDVVSRFFNEARAATTIRHPGVIEVYDFGFLEDGTAYILMEYLEGESLAARMRRGRFTIETMLTTVRAIARALQAVHAHGIVHRDLKPDNVFLVPDPELPSGERVKLLDFGLAKLASATGGARHRHTTTGVVLGTPTYMSPEQCRGVDPVDHRADLYSLGCIAYEMLCGQPPFTAEGPGELIARHLYFAPSSLREQRGDVWPELERLVLRLLEKDPGARFHTAAELVCAIDQLAAATPRVTSIADLIATLSMTAGIAVGGARPTTRRPRRAVRGYRMCAFAGGATVGIALVVLLLWFARSTGFELLPSGRLDPEAFRRPLLEVLAVLRRALPGLATLPLADGGSVSRWSMAVVLSAAPFRRPGGCRRMTRSTRRRRREVDITVHRA